MLLTKGTAGAAQSALEHELVAVFSDLADFRQSPISGAIYGLCCRTPAGDGRNHQALGDSKVRPARDCAGGRTRRDFQSERIRRAEPQIPCDDGAKPLLSGFLQRRLAPRWPPEPSSCTILKPCCLRCRRTPPDGSGSPSKYRIVTQARPLILAAGSKDVTGRLIHPRAFGRIESFAGLWPFQREQP
jgi:hypothetical protein